MDTALTPSDQASIEAARAELAQQLAGGDDGDGGAQALASSGQQQAQQPQGAQSSSAQAPQMIKVGETEYTPEQVQEFITKAQTADAEIAKNAILAGQAGPALELKATWDAMPESIRNKVLALIEGEAQAELNRRNGIVPEIEKQMAGITQVEWKDMSDEGKMAMAGIYQLQKDIGQLFDLVKDIKSHIDPIHERDQDALTATALKAKGINATPELVRQMKANGIADPIKAIEFLGPQMKAQFSAGKQEGENKTPPLPEAPGAKAGTYDDTDVNLTADQELVYLQQGLVPVSSLKK